MNVHGVAWIDRSGFTLDGLSGTVASVDAFGVAVDLDSPAEAFGDCLAAFNGAEGLPPSRLFVQGEGCDDLTVESFTEPSHSVA